jgi:hypothetical protein
MKRTHTEVLKRVFLEMAKTVQKIGDKEEYQGYRNEMSNGVEDSEREQLFQDLADPSQPEYLDATQFRQINQRETRYSAIVFALLGIILWIVFASFFLINNNFANGYLRMRVPPSPGPWKSARYGVTWGFCYFMFFNFLSPVTLMMAVAEYQYVSRLTLHWGVNLLLIIGNGVSFVFFLVIGLAYCNWNYSASSICNSYLFCCVYGSTNQDWCPTSSGMCTPSVSAGTLGWQTNFYWLWLFSLFFFLYGVFSFGMNKNITQISITSAINVNSNLD